MLMRQIKADIELKPMPVEVVWPSKEEPPPPQFKTLAGLERDTITAVLGFYPPKVAAKVLGIGLSTLYSRMEFYGLTTRLQVARRSRNRNCSK